jgi:hypothetical protein
MFDQRPATEFLFERDQRLGNHDPSDAATIGSQRQILAWRSKAHDVFPL